MDPDLVMEITSLQAQLRTYKLPKGIKYFIECLLNAITSKDYRYTSNLINNITIYPDLPYPIYITCNTLYNLLQTKELM